MERSMGEKELLSRKLEEDRLLFLSAGGKIQMISTGKTGCIDGLSKGQKRGIVINPHKGQKAGAL